MEKAGHDTGDSLDNSADNSSQEISCSSEKTLKEIASEQSSGFSSSKKSREETTTTCWTARDYESRSAEGRDSDIGHRGEGRDDGAGSNHSGWRGEDNSWAHSCATVPGVEGGRSLGRVAAVSEDRSRSNYDRSRSKVLGRRGEGCSCLGSSILGIEI